MADDVAQGGIINARARFFLAATHAGEMPRDAMTGANDEVAGAGGHVADFEAQQRTNFSFGDFALANRSAMTGSSADSCRHWTRESGV